MGKSRSKKRRAESEQRSPSSIAASLIGKRKVVELESGTIEPEDIEITIQTLNRVASQEGTLLEILAAKRYKDLRRALHPFQEAWRERFDPVDYPARVTTLLEQQQWTPVLFALEGCAYYFESKLKRGTIQRWVRFCDECQSPGLKLKLIAAILRCASPETSDDQAIMNRHDPRRVLLEQDLEGIAETANRVKWNPPECQALPFISDEGWKVPADIHVIHHVSAEDRKPPNHHDLKISHTDTSVLSQDYNTLAIEKHQVPPIPGAVLLTNVLMGHECRRLILTAERMGYSPDHPIESKEATGIDTCEWLALKDSELLFQRVLPHLPATIQEEAVTGINSRWRLFRYSTDSVYRPHIDGSWPASALQDGKYISDESHRSRLTFLVYLNDGFEGGGTTFYLPKSRGLEAISVTPHAGNVLLFPQGNTASLVHEGSKVESKDCCKYVIRTDVLYRKK